MLKAILLAACLASASPEWVEISQNHYRKPLRTNTQTKLEDRSPYYPKEENAQRTHDYARKEDVRFPFTPHKDTSRVTPGFPDKEETSVQHNFQHQYEESIYSNHSIEEHTWNLKKYHASGDIKRIDSELKVKANITPEFSLEIYGTAADNRPELVTRNKVSDQDTASATIEKVPNKGNVKRVHLPNTPVKSPSVTKFGSEIQPIKRSDIRIHETTSAYDENSDEFDIRSDIFQGTHKVIDLNPYDDDVKSLLSTAKETMHVFTSTRSTPVRSYDRIMTSTTRPISELDTSYHKFHAKSDNEIEGNNKTKTIKVSNPLDSDSDPNIRYTQRKPFKTVNENREDNFKDIPKLHTMNNKHMEQVKEADFGEVTTGSDDRISDDDTISLNQNKKPLKVNAQVTKDQDSKSDMNDEGKNKTNNRNKENTMENVLKFMKVIADVISKNSKRGVEGKVQYLNELKDTLLYSIKERVDATWPDDGTGARRRSRAASARGHVEFPSSESALMTISFLTFAVFLIKLVLQVIQTYKTKAMVMAPLVVATAGRAFTQLPTSR